MGKDGFHIKLISSFEMLIKSMATLVYVANRVVRYNERLMFESDDSKE